MSRNANALLVICASILANETVRSRDPIGHQLLEEELRRFRRDNGLGEYAESRGEPASQSTREAPMS